MFSPIHTLRLVESNVCIAAPFGQAQLKVFEHEDVESGVSCTVCDDTITIKGNSKNGVVTLGIDPRSAIRKIALEAGAMLSFAEMDRVRLQPLFDFFHSGGITIELGANCQVHNVPPMFGNAVNVVSSHPEAHICGGTQRVLNLSECRRATVSDFEVLDRLVLPSVCDTPSQVVVKYGPNATVEGNVSTFEWVRPRVPRSSTVPEPPAQRRRENFSVSFTQFPSSEPLDPVIGNIMSIFGNIVSQMVAHSTSDADVADPDGRLAEVEREWRERVKNLYEIKGFLRKADTDFHAFLGQAHPSLLPRLLESSLAHVRSTTTDMRAQYKPCDDLPPVAEENIETESNPDLCCIICQDVKATLLVCVQCSSAKTCEACLTRQVLMLNDLCCVCNSTKMRRPVVALD